jgi:hypothetical protein
MMLITLDNLAHRYNCLPSEALERCTTFDLKVLDTSTKWHNYKNEQENARLNPESKKKPEDFSQDQLKAILNTVK